MENRMITRCVSVVLAIGMTACGGGGGGGDEKGSPATPSTQVDPTKVNRVEANQNSASALVQVALANVDEVAQAATVDDIPGLSSATGVKRLTQIQSTSMEVVQPSVASSYNCSSLGGGNGSGTYTADVDYNTSTGETNTRITYDKCSYTQAGITYTLNGYSTSRTTKTSDSTMVYFSDYDLTTQVSGPYGGTYKYKGSQTCTYSNSSYSCSYNVGDSAVSSISGVSVNGNTTTITSATIKTKRDDSANSLTVTYKNWQYDSVTGRASGTVTITDSLGNTATVVANGNTYTVTIKYNGVESVYTVTV